MGRTYVIRNEPARASALNRSMIQEYPDFPLGHWFLGLSLLADGKQDAARLEIKEALKLGYRCANADEESMVKKLLGEQEYGEAIKSK